MNWLRILLQSLMHIIDRKADKSYVDERIAGCSVEETDPTVPDWAKKPDKPKYTADEVGAQPKGDYALKSEIPTVPVASVNGKTGAVTLNAADVGAVPEGELELITDITVEEDTAIIDARGFKLRSLFALMWTPATDAGASGYGYVHSEDEMFYLSFSGLLATSAKYTKTFAEVRNGVIDIRSNAPLGATNGSGSYLGAVWVSAAPITRIRYGVNNNGVFPTGTNLKVWGVRANA